MQPLRLRPRRPATTFVANCPVRALLLPRPRLRMHALMYVLIFLNFSSHMVCAACAFLPVTSGNYTAVQEGAFGFQVCGTCVPSPCTALRSRLPPILQRWSTHHSNTLVVLKHSFVPSLFTPLPFPLCRYLFVVSQTP